MTTAPFPPRIDERAINAGTTVRFVLLMALLLVVSGSMMLDVTTGLGGSDTFGCSLAAGADPQHDLTTVFYRFIQRNAFDACVARYEWLPPWWVSFVWPISVLAVARALFWGLSAWKARRGRVVPLEAVDHDGAIRAALEDLAAKAGLEHAPRVVVDPAAASTGAVVFGSNSRPTIRLDGGLLARRTADPDRFRAVLLHELAHIRGGDVTITYATVAVWRAFLLVVLLPYLVWSTADYFAGLESPSWPSFAPTVARGLTLAIFLVMLVYLARSEVLRSREIYADLAAVRSGADPRGWAGGADRGARGWAFGSFAELWHTHPRLDLRRRSLDDPAALFGVRALPMFLTGAAVTVMNADVTEYVRIYDFGLFGQGGPWQAQVIALAGPALVIGVVGIALWRAVAYAVLTERRVPSGVLAGLSLGTGMATGEVLVGQPTVYQWLPNRPGFFVLVVLAGTVVTWWTAQCAHLWIRTWRGRTVRPVMILGLATAFLALSAWLVWWEYEGVLMAGGLRFDPAVLHRLLGQTSPAIAADHPAMVTVINVTLSVLAGIPSWPLILYAVMALWVVPLLAWTIRPATTTPGWVSRTLRSDGQWAAVAPPPLRRVLLPGALGGVVYWAAAAGLQAYMHTWPTPLEQRNGLYLLIYLAWSVSALAVAAAAAAAAASALAGRYRLLVALIAAQTATLVGFSGLFVLTSIDGCVRPLTTFQSSCAWRPGLAWGNLGSLLALAFMFGVFVAAAAAGAVSVLRSLSRRRGSPEQAEPVRPGQAVARRWLAGGYGAVAVVVTLAVVITRTGTAAQASPPQASTPRSASPSAQQLEQSLVPVISTASARTRAMQMAAWRSHGGDALLSRFAEDWSRLTKVLDEVVVSVNNGAVTLSPARPVCADIGNVAGFARGYFHVPDAQAQRAWQRLVEQAADGSKSCAQALDRQDLGLFKRSVKTLTEAANIGLSAYERINAVSRSG